MTTIPFDGRDAFEVYTGRTTCWPMVGATVVALAVLAVVGASSTSNVASLGLVTIGIGVVGEVVTGSSVRATAGPNGLTIRWGVLGWPRLTYRRERIARAEVVDTPWWRVAYGFWWTPRRTNCTLRSGPTLRVTLTDGRTVIVTVPDPHAAATALRAGD